MHRECSRPGIIPGSFTCGEPSQHCPKSGKRPAAEVAASGGRGEHRIADVAAALRRTAPTASRGRHTGSDRPPPRNRTNLGNARWQPPTQFLTARWPDLTRRGQAKGQQSTLGLAPPLASPVLDRDRNRIGTRNRRDHRHNEDWEIPSCQQKAAEEPVLVSGHPKTGRWRIGGNCWWMCRARPRSWTGFCTTRRSARSQGGAIGWKTGRRG